MDFYFYYDVYGPYRLTPEQVRDRTFYGSESTLAVVRRRFHPAWLLCFEEDDYVVHHFCWIARRAWQGVRRMMVGGESERTYDRLYVHCWESPRPSPFEAAARSLLRRLVRLRTAAPLFLSEAAKWVRRLRPSKTPRHPDSIA